MGGIMKNLWFSEFLKKNIFSNKKIIFKKYNDLKFSHLTIPPSPYFPSGVKAIDFKEISL